GAGRRGGRGRDRLDGRGRREDRERLTERGLGEPVNSRAACFGGAGNRTEPLGAGAAAVETDERVPAVDSDGGAVEELLDRQALGCDLRRLPNLHRAPGGRPLVRAGAGELEQPQRWLDVELALEHSLDGGGNVLEPVEPRAECTRELRDSQQRAEVASGEGRAPLLLDGL